MSKKKSSRIKIDDSFNYHQFIEELDKEHNVSKKTDITPTTAVANISENSEKKMNLRKKVPQNDLSKQKVVVDDTFDLDYFEDPDSSCSEYNPDSSDSEIDRVSPRIINKKRKLEFTTPTSTSKGGKISDSDSYKAKNKKVKSKSALPKAIKKPPKNIYKRDTQPSGSSIIPLANDDPNNKSTRSSQPLEPIDLPPCTAVSPEKAKYTKNSRIRTLNTMDWQENKRKHNRNNGLEYQSKKKGNKDIIRTFPARKIGSPCPCKKRCFETLGSEAIEKIFKNYWGLGSYDLQTADLQTKVFKADIKRRRPKKTNVCKSGTYQYFVSYKGERYNVCRVAFLSIHDITKDRVISAYGKKTDTDTVELDQRGKTQNARRFSGPKLDCVHEHIQSIRVRSSHYTRFKNPNRQYIDIPSRTFISTLFGQYRNWMKVNHPLVEIVKPRYYNKIFSTHYNIASLPPKKDLCDVCFENKIKQNNYKDDPDKLNDLINENKIHNNKVKIALDAINACKPKKGEKEVKNPDCHAIVMDLQQTQPCPRLNVGVAYYKRKLSFYNFCVYNLQTGKGYMYVWTENTAKRGSVEIYSCMYKYLKDHLLNKPDYPKTLKIFADNCGGQNKNNNICLALLMDIHKNIFERVELSYLVPGHSYNACDREFGHVELKYRTQNEILTPEDYIYWIEHRTNAKNYVYHMERKDFLNIEIFSTKDTTTRLAYVRPTKDKVFQKARQIIIKKSVPYGYILKQDFNVSDEKGTLINVVESGTPKGEFDLSMVNLQPKYKTELKLNSLKIKDIRLLVTRYITDSNRIFWDKLFEQQEKLDADCEYEDETEITEPDDQSTESLDRIWDEKCVKKIL